MGTSRRNFLKTGSMGLLCVGVPSVLADIVAAHPARAFRQDRSLVLSQASFSPYLNTTFRVAYGEETVNLTLTTITDIKAAHPSKIAGKECFSLLFVSPRGSVLTDGIYTLEHDALGMLSLFLVRVGKPGGGRFEAVFSLL